MWKTTFWMFLFVCVFFVIRPSLPSLPEQEVPVSGLDSDEPQLVNFEQEKQLSEVMPPSLEKDLWTDKARRIQVEFAAGGYVTALQMADRVSHDHDHASLYEWVQKELPTLLDHAAWSYLHRGSCDKALRLFERGVQRRRTVDNSYGLGFCARKQGQMQLAYEALSWNTQNFPEHRVSWLLFAEVLESLHDFRGASDALREAYALDENKTQSLQNKIDAMERRSELQENLQHVSGEWFRLSWPYHTDLAVDFLVGLLEKALQDFVEQGYRKPLAPIEIFLYEREDFHELVPGAPGWVDGLFDGRLRIPIQRQPNLQRLENVLRHELSHAFVAQMNDSRRLPPWWDEGMAQRASCPKAGCPVMDNKKLFFPDRSVLEARFTTLDAQQAQQAYDVSAFLIRWLEMKNHIAWKSMLMQMDHQSRIDSDSLVAPFQSSFDELYTEAQDFWLRGDGLP